MRIEKPCSPHTNLKLIVNRPYIETISSDSSKDAKAYENRCNTLHYPNEIQEYTYRQEECTDFYEEEPLFESYNIEHLAILDDVAKNDETLFASQSRSQYAWHKLQYFYKNLRLWPIAAGIIGYMTICNLLDLLI